MNDSTDILYVNVYEIERLYGGPEEGGWWYDAGTLVFTEQVVGMKEAETLREDLHDDYPRTGNRYSVLGGEDFDIRIEDQPGEDFPQYQPRYE